MILKSDGIENVILLIKIILQRIICFYKKVLLLIIRFAIRHQWTNKLKKFIKKIAIKDLRSRLL